ncbi:MAG: C69 family dipeptidase [Synergistaceae bacterium]|nr:C69 family dipeptidase [Synergistaceae bacterium]
MRNVKVRRLFALTVLCLFMLGSADAWGCTSFVVGKDASASGYPMFSRTEDSVSVSAKRFFVYPTGYYKEGQTVIDTQFLWTWTWTHDSYRMTATPDMPINSLHIYDQAGVNEYGYMMSTTNSTSFRSQVNDPLVRPGFAESLMQTVLLGEAKNADEALTLWGKIVEEQGMAEGCFWMLNDAGGNIWITENFGGHRWAAARVPDDSFCVIGNDCIIDYIDLTDTKNYRGSKDIIEHVVSLDIAIYGPVGSPYEGKVNVAASYANLNSLSNSLRRWMGLHLFAPSQNIALKPSTERMSYPTFVKPDRKISALDIMNFQRSRYEGTSFDLGETPQVFGTGGLGSGGNAAVPGRYVHMYSESDYTTIPNPFGTGTTSGRPIGYTTQKEAHIYEQIPELPPDIAARWWFIEGQPEHSVNLPFYGNINDTHPAYKKFVGQRAYDPESAFWIFRDLTQLARSNRKMYGQPIRTYWHNLEKKLYAEQEAVTQELIARHKADPKDAAEWITDYTIATAQAAMNRAGLFRKALLKHIDTNSGDLFVVPSDSVPFTNGTFDIHPTSGDALLTTTDIYDVANTLGISEWTVKPAYLKLPNPYPLQRFTPKLYTIEDLATGHPAALGDGATVLPIPGVRVFAEVNTQDLSGGNLIKVRYTAELQGDVYKIFENSVENVKKGFSLHAMLPGYAKGYELVGPNGLVTLSNAVKTGKAWVFGDKERATVMIDFYLYDDAGAPAYGNGGKIVVPDGKADFALDTGKLWAAAYSIEEDDDDDECKLGCQAFNPGILLGIALMMGLLFRSKR